VEPVENKKKNNKLLWTWSTLSTITRFY